MENKMPISIIIQKTRSEMISATSEIMKSNGVPACLMELIISEILADIRVQSSTEIVIDLQRQLLNAKNDKSDGGKDE